jgi:hypothetical protein
MKWFRWGLFIPLGVVEILMLLLVLVLLAVNKRLALMVFESSRKLPGINWYSGNL